MCYVTMVPFARQARLAKYEPCTIRNRLHDRAWFPGGSGTVGCEFIPRLRTGSASMEATKALTAPAISTRVIQVIVCFVLSRHALVQSVVSYCQVAPQA